MQDNKIIFESREKILDTIKISNKAKRIMDESITNLKEIEIPSDFECFNRIKESINLLGNLIHNIDVTNKRLFIKVEEIWDARNRYGYAKLNFDIVNIGAYGMSYEELANMKSDELISVLGKKVLEAPVIQYFKNPLDMKNSEIPRYLKTKNMLNYLYRIENRYKEKISVCEGGTCLGKNVIAYCDVDTNTGKGLLRIMVEGEKYKNKKQYYARTAIEVSSIEVEGHSNDLAYIPENRILLHIDDKNDRINVYKVDEDYSITKVKSIDNIKANGITYDKGEEKVIILNGRYVDSYSKKEFVNKNTKTKPKAEKKCIIPNIIKDKDNSTYYNYVQGMTAYDGCLYITYTGFSTDKERYSYDNGDIPLGNMTAIYDYENGGKAIGTFRDDVGIEIESIDTNEEKDFVFFYNGGPYTRIFETDLVNAETIAKDYKASKNENNYIEVAKNESNHKDKPYNQKNS